MKGKMLFITSALALVCVHTTACKNNDAGVSDTLPAQADKGVAVIDSGMTPPQDYNVTVQLERPDYLQSAVSKDTEIVFAVLYTKVELDEAKKALQHAFSLRLLPDRTTIAGSWEPRFSLIGGGEMAFKPDQPLEEDREYEISVTPSKLLTPIESRSYFHVGSHPRVVAIKFMNGAVGSGVLDIVGIEFSERVSVASAAAGIQVLVGGKALSPLKLVNGSDIDYAIVFQHETGFAADVEHTIEVATDVGLAKKLDSDYSGKESQDPLVVTLKPGDHTVENAWQPTLSF